MFNCKPTSSVVCECNGTCAGRWGGNGGGGGYGSAGSRGGGTGTNEAWLNVYVTVELVATIS